MYFCIEMQDWLVVRNGEAYSGAYTDHPTILCLHDNRHVADLAPRAGFTALHVLAEHLFHEPFAGTK
jgi:hypothetical protein